VATKQSTCGVFELQRELLLATDIFVASLKKTPDGFCCSDAAIVVFSAA